MGRTPYLAQFWQLVSGNSRHRTQLMISNLRPRQPLFHQPKKESQIQMKEKRLGRREEGAF